MLTLEDLGENTIANLGYDHMWNAIRAHHLDETLRSPRNRCLLMHGLARDYLGLTGAFIDETFGDFGAAS